MNETERQEDAENRRQKAITLKQCFGTEAGRVAFRYILEISGFFESTIDPNPTILAFNDGRRNVALSLVKALQVDPEVLFKFYFKGSDINIEDDFDYDEDFN